MLSVLTVAVTLALASPPAATLALAPVEDAELAGVTAEELEAAFRARLKKDKTFSVVDGDAARYRLEVVRCARGQDVTRRNERWGPDPVLTGPKMIKSGAKEQGYGAAVTSRTAVEMVVRLTWDGRFAEVTSASQDRDLKDAVDTVVRRLHGAIR